MFWKKALALSSPFRAIENYREVYYGNLVLHPQRELRRLCDYLHIEYVPEKMFSYPQLNAGLELVPRRRLGWHEATLRNIKRRKISEWKQGLRLGQILLFELLAGNDLKSHGFELLLPFSGLEIVNRGFMKLETRLSGLIDASK